MVENQGRSGAVKAVGDGPRVRAAAVVAIVVGLFVVAPSRPAAHEVPTDVTVRMFVKPEGGTLRLLARAPLAAMRDFEFPVQGPGYLDLTAAQPVLENAAIRWIATYLELFENDSLLGTPRIAAVRVSLPSDPAFGRYDDALAHVTGAPLAEGTDLYWEQALLDVLFEYAIESDQSDFAIRPAVAHLGLKTLTVLRFLPSGGAERIFQYVGDPGRVRLDPRWHQATWRFVSLGFFHILDGLDHLLFLLCLVVPFRKFWSLVPIITSFTVAHSITLIASASGLAPSALWFPPLIETLIAASIVYMALENIVGAKLHRRWVIAFAFGLVHGFGFSFVLGETLQFAGSHLTTSLLAFNVGVEVGQLFVVVLAIPVLDFAFRRVVAERIGTIILSALLLHTGWHWMTERGSEVLQYRFAWPALDLHLVAAAMRWLMLLAIVGGAIWVLRTLYGRLAGRIARAGEAAVVGG